jgi:hypothetical protein
MGWDTRADEPITSGWTEGGAWRYLRGPHVTAEGQRTLEATRVAEALWRLWIATGRAARW